MQIDGITNFNMLLGSNFYVSRSYYKQYLSHVEFNVTVIEKGTQTAINSTETVVTSEYDYVASFLPGSPRMFKPGLPFTLKVYISCGPPDYFTSDIDICLYRSM